VGAHLQRRQAKAASRQVIAASRQKWIDTLRDAISEYHSIAMSEVNLADPENDKKL
jgi:hypothetical protein